MQAQKPHSKLNTKTKSIILLLCLFLSIFSSYHYELKKSRSSALLFTQKFKPYISASFNTQIHEFIIDTGAAYHSILDDDIANQLDDKKFFSNIELTDFDNNKFMIDEFYAEKVNFLDIRFEKFFFLRPPNSFFGNNHYTNEPQHSLIFTASRDDPFSYIGHQLLARMNVGIDFKKNIFKLYKPGLVPIYDYPYGFFKFEKKLPLEYSSSIGPVCIVNTDYGLKRFLIDTGCPFSIIHPSKLQIEDSEIISVELKNFKISNKNFGPFKIHLETKTLSEKIDGILGLDFFQNKQLFLNIPENYFCLRN